jgi:hypothetical protein
MPDPLDGLLKLVAEGRLTAEEAAPLIDALQGTMAGAAPDDQRADGDGSSGSSGAAGSADADVGGTGRDRPRALRIEVSEDGRRVVNLRIPLSLGRMALDHVPGLSTDNITRIREALEQGMTGSLLVVDEGDNGDGVRIILE